MPQQITQPPQNFNLPLTQKPGFGWGKAAGMLFAVLIPAGLVAYANHVVFPESSWLALGMIVITCGIAGIFSVASGYATPNVRRYCLIASLILCIVLSANLAAHWVLSREASGAKQATTARHVEEDRAEARREAEARRQKELVDEQRALIAGQRDLAQAEAKRFNAEAWRNNTARRLGIAPPGVRPASPQVGPTASALPAQIVEPTPAPAVGARADEAPRLTLEQVMEKWSGWLLWFAIGDLLISVVAFGVCALMWEWDKNRNGIPDHLEQFILAQRYLNQQSQPVQIGQVVQPVQSAQPARQPVNSHNGSPRP